MSDSLKPKRAASDPNGRIPGLRVSYDWVKELNPKPAINQLKRFDWKRWIAWLKYKVWFGFSKVGLGLAYVTMTAEGLAMIWPSAGMKMSRLPLFHWMANHPSMYRFTVAGVIVAPMVYIGSVYLWDRMLRLWLYGDQSVLPNSASDAAKYEPRKEKFFSGLAMILLSSEAFLFYISQTYSTFGGSKFSFTALVVTAMYIGLLVFATISTLELRNSLKQEEKRNEEQQTRRVNGKS